MAGCDRQAEAGLGMQSGHRALAARQSAAWGALASRRTAERAGTLAVLPEPFHGSGYAACAKRHPAFAKTHFHPAEGGHQHEIVEVADMADAESTPGKPPKPVPQRQIEALPNMRAGPARSAR